MTPEELELTECLDDEIHELAKKKLRILSENDRVEHLSYLVMTVNSLFRLMLKERRER